MKNFTISSLLYKSFNENKNNVALFTDFGHITYSSVLLDAAKLAYKLEKDGVKVGDKVAIRMARNYQYVETFLTLLMYGYCAVPLDSSYPDERLDYIVSYSDSKVVVDESYFDEALKLNESKSVPTISEDVLACIVFTSGSTGKPKGVMYSQLALYESVIRHYEYFDFKKEDIVANTSPFTFAVFVFTIIAPASSGASMVIVPLDIVKDVNKLADFYETNHVTFTYLAPKILRYFKPIGHSLKHVLTGSEKISQIGPQGYKLTAVYGMTELVGLLTCYQIDKPYLITPLGKSISATSHLYILDENGQESNIGELCVTGHFFSGYYKNEEQTKLCLVPNPFKNIDGYEYMVKTGDLVEMGEDNNLIYHNRLDWMVKVNGQRVEPGEIEVVIKELPQIDDAVIKGFTNKYDQTYLVAFYTKKECISVAQIKAYLASKLASYMMPLFFVELDKFPVNANGKLDRLALKEPEATLYKNAYIAPTNKIEEKICQAFTKVLGVKDVGVNDDFFALGGDSIKSIILTKELENIEVKDVLLGKTPKGIALRIKNNNLNDINVKSKQLNAKYTPLTHSQMGVYLDSLDNASSNKYNIPFEYTFNNQEFDAHKLCQAINKVINFYSAFKTVIRIKDGTPCNHLIEEELKPIIVEQTSEDEYKKIRQNFVQPFSLTSGYLYRILLLQTENYLHLLVDFHHLIYDGTSSTVFIDALKKAYKEEPLEIETISLFEQSYLENNEQIDESDYKFYDNYLNGVELDSSIEVDKASQVDDKKEVITAPLNASYIDVEDFTKKNNITENSFLLGAFCYALAKFNGTNEALFTSVNNGRNTYQYDNSIGMFVKSFPVYLHFDEEETISEYLFKVQKTLFNVLTHLDIPYSSLASRYNLDTNIKFVYQGEMLEDFLLDNNKVKVNQLPISDAMGHMDIMITKSKGSYEINLSYRRSRYTNMLMSAFVNFYRQVVDEFLVKDKLKEINLVDEASFNFIKKVNATEKNYDSKLTAIDLFNKVVRQYPNKLAVSYKEKSYTYKQLDNLASKLAYFIQNKKLGKDDFVALLVPRTEYMAITALGVSMSGCAYQPLDPTYPKERLNFMVKDAGVKLVIADRSLINLLDEYNGEVLYTDEIANLENGPLQNNISPSDAFIIIYTSGTTGIPKGCILEHKNIVCLSYNHWAVMEMNENSNVAAFASFGFDAGAMEIFTTLLLGASLFIIPDEIKFDLDKTNEFYIKNNITTGFMTTQVARMFAEMTTCKTLHSFTFGGEKLVPFVPQKGINFINGYGPSEAFAYVCSHMVIDDSKIQPIGKPIGNTKLYLFDKYLRLLPPGAVGELCIASPQVGRGYLNRLDKTKEVFITNPFNDGELYKRMYKTGDIVRLLPMGEFDFIGRKDNQVKVRGFRIELTEIEQVIRQYKDIKDATVQAFDGPNGKFIAAYLVSDITIDIKSLNDFIKARKPEYMVPAFSIQIKSIPLTVNGKVDKRQLIKPEIKLEEIILPRNDLENKLYSLLEEVLNTSNFGVNTNYFEAGLNSIGCIKFISLIYNNLHASLTIKQLKEHPSIEQLCDVLRIENAFNYEIKENYPLTKTQMGIFIETISSPNTLNYNIPNLLRLDASIDPYKLEQAIIKAVDAHPYLKAKIKYNELGEAILLRHDESKVMVERIKIDNINVIKDSLVKPFDLLKDDLYRISIIEAENLYLFIDIHHIISDGTSIALLVNEISNVYLKKECEREPINGYDISLLEEQERKGPALIEAKQYFNDLLNGYDSDFNFKPTLLNDSRIDVGSIEFFEQVGKASEVMAYCLKNNVSINGFMCALFGFILAKYNNTDYSIFTTVYNGRNSAKYAKTMSMLVKTLPVLANINQDSGLEYIKSMSNQLLNSMANDIYSFAEISHELGIKNDIMFIYQGDNFQFDTFANKPSVQIADFNLDNKADFCLQVFLKDNKFIYKLDYNNKLYNDDFFMVFLRALDFIVAQFLHEDKLNAIEVCDPQTLALMDSYNDFSIDYNSHESVLTGIYRQVKDQPSWPAVVYKDKVYTYEKLHIEALKIACYLTKLGIGKGDFVSVIISRNEFMPITAYGVTLSGAAYQPLDPTYPKERLNFMVKDCGAKLLIADPSLRHLLDEYEGEVLYTDSIYSLPYNLDFHVDLNSLDALTIVYTSGSTGTPKGCILEHGNLLAFSIAHQHNVQLDKFSRVASFASFGFDANIMDIFSTLYSGATLYIVPDEIKLDLAKIDEFYINNDITHGFMTTQLGRMFAVMSKCQTLKYFLMGGESLSHFKPREQFKACNGYGPSETIAYVTLGQLKDDSSLVPIGKVTPNCCLYIVDKYMHRLPMGACGELLISGPQVGRGYLNRSEKTKEVFINNPFNASNKYKRMYKTGDIVRALPDGNYDFIGRRDGQVKIRGFRVELVEVEAVIREYPSIINVSVQALENPSGGKSLVAYIVADKKIDIIDLNNFIGGKKPPYMVPSATIQVENIPLNANGKVDKKKLIKPDFNVTHKGQEPSDAIEKTFCQIFKEVLGLEKVYADDDFFQIGGSSISAIQVVVKADNAGYKIVYKNLFDYQTPIKLAEFINGKKMDEKFAPTGKEKEQYDYSCLDYNVVNNLTNIKFNDLGTVFLTGVTGFLGSHIIKELIDNTNSHVICAVRSKKELSSINRFKAIMFYYFADWLSEDKMQRINIVDVDLTNKLDLEKLNAYKIDTIINSAANVKHFALEKDLYRDNVTVVELLIDFAKENKAKLVQISSLSVCGESVNGNVALDFVFKENNLNIGQSLENKYVYTKFLAEQALVNAISKKEVRGKIIRLGNLMARNEDGEFQINAQTNALCKQFIGYASLGCYPVDMMDAEIEFSPIDATARACVLLSGTPDEFTCFHAKNCNSIHYGYFLMEMKKIGFNIDIVESDVFQERFKEVLKHDDVGKYTGFIAYLDKADSTVSDAAKYTGGSESISYDMRVKIKSDTAFTTKALYRLGFQWPLIDNKYLDNMIKLLVKGKIFKVK